MDIDCPHCRATMPAVALEKGKRKISCPYCCETFRISKVQQRMAKGDYAHKDLKPLQQIMVLPPEDSKISVENYGTQETHITIRGPQWALGCFMLFFTMFWNSIVGVFTVLMIMGELKDVGWWMPLFLTPFWLVGIGTAITALFALFGRTSIILDPFECTVRNSVFGIGYNKSVYTPDIVRVDWVESYRQNNRPVYAIALCTESRKLKFASLLNEDSKKWLLEFVKKTLNL